MTTLNIFRAKWWMILLWPVVGMLLVAWLWMVSYLQWQGRHLRPGAVALITSGLLLAFAAISTLVLRRMVRRHRADLVRDAYRTASEGTSDGFFYMAAVRDGAGTLIDFEIADCNQAGADLVGAQRAGLLGRRLRQCDIDAYFPAMMASYREAMVSPSGRIADHEVEVPDDSMMRARWLRRRLVRVGDGVAVTLQDISQLKAQEQDLIRLANEDGLTGLPNRHWLGWFLPGAIERARAGGAMLALLLVDLDGFKDINDSRGHAAGDTLLRGAAERLSGLLRPSDRVAHLGGDEFVVILKQLQSEQQAAQLAQRIGGAFEQPFVFDGSVERVGASVGISLFPRDGADTGTLLKHADIALHAVKQGGKGHHRFYAPAQFEQLRSRRQTERELAAALDDDQFFMLYQPRVDAVSGQLCGMEALVRWAHPERGIVAPLEFIGVAESSGLIAVLGAAVIDKVCRQIALWQAAGVPLVPVSINVAVHQFERGDLYHLLLAAMARHAVEARWLEIEITESAMMDGAASTLTQLTALRACGFKLLVDDFGTGYSSLSQLQRFAMDGLKIDRSFTVELGQSKQGEIFVGAILSMAHALGMRVVAEGVETEQQAAILRRLGCDELQGYLLSRPISATQIEPSMARRRLPEPLECT